ncbi:hypothetical protein HK101_002319, partial [Irineochytrium annulatum]
MSLSISCPKAEIREDHVVFYQVSITAGLRSWSVWRRYSEFEALHNAWMSQFPHAPPPHNLPSKNLLSIFGLSTSADPKRIDERRHSLEEYLVAVLLAKDDRWRTSKEWANFLGLPDTNRRSFVTGLAANGAIPAAGSDAASTVSSAPTLNAEEWMDEYRSIQSACREVRAHAAARDRHSSTGDTAAAQSAAIQGKKAVIAVSTRLCALEECLRAEEKLVSEAGGTSGSASVTSSLTALAMLGV